MKIYRNCYSRSIFASDKNTAKSIGTKFYHITLDDLKKAYKTTNPFLYQYLIDAGLNAIDIESMYGSRIIGDDLYFCITDGQDIKISKHGESVSISPENALDVYEENLSILDKYIKDSVDDKFIRSHITPYEFLTDDMKDSIDKYAKLSLNSGSSFVDLISAYEQIFIGLDD